LRDALARLTLRIETACGGIDVPLKLDYWPEWKTGNLQDGDEVDVTVMPAGDTRREIDLLIDNRGRPDGMLSVGRTDIALSADSSGTISVRVDDTCAAGREIKLDGVRIAELPAVDPTTVQATLARNSSVPSVESDPDLSTALAANVFLIDPTGKRCYEERFHQYGESIGPLASPSYGPGPPPDLTISTSHVHRLRATIDFPFRDPPQEIKLPTIAGYNQLDRGLRSSLRQIDCAAN
jgi:hypothetical protein